MIIDTECPRCNGLGEVNATTPRIRSRYVGRDDIDPSDYTEDCPECSGSGVVHYDPEVEIDDWMKP